MTALLVFVIATAQEGPLDILPEQPSIAEVVLDQNATFAGLVERALENNVKLLNHHRGYLNYLESHPELEAGEEAYTEVMRFPPLRDLVHGFDESLGAKAAAQAQFDSYYAFLAKYPDVRRAVDGLHRLDLENRDPLFEFGGAVQYLRANPGEANTFLANPPRLGTTPPDLYALMRRFQSDPSMRTRLRGYFEELDDNPLVHLRAYPWWSTLGMEDDPVASSYERLYAYAAQRPRWFWALHRREIGLGSDARGRDWIRYWWRLVRREPTLGGNYINYLTLLRGQPELRAAAARRWDEALGAADVWPPDGKPPTPPTWKPSSSRGSTRPDRAGQRGTAPPRPGRSTYQMPRRPVRPGKPTRPTMPLRPPVPPRPPKSSKQITPYNY